MGTIAGSLIGLAVAVFGFAAMRDPMRLNLNPFSPSAKAYYQRMVLDTTMRIRLRIFGALVCLFGSGIFTAFLGSALRVSSLNTVSKGLWVLMGAIFFTAWGGGLILTIRQLIKGEIFNWWRMWKVSADLGPIDAFPPVTPKMRSEARFFTIALLSLALISAIAALFHRFA
jgi:hypothetical protein